MMKNAQKRRNHLLPKLSACFLLLFQFFLHAQVSDPEKPRLIFQLGHTQPVKSVAISRNGGYAASLSKDKLITWDRLSGQVAYVEAADYNPNALAFINNWVTLYRINQQYRKGGNVRSLLSLQRGEQLLLINPANGKVYREIKIPPYNALKGISLIDWVGSAKEPLAILKGSYGLIPFSGDETDLKTYRSFGRWLGVTKDFNFFATTKKHPFLGKQEISLTKVYKRKSLMSWFASINDSIVLSPDFFTYTFSNFDSLAAAVSGERRRAIVEGIQAPPFFTPDSRYIIGISKQTRQLTLWDVETGNVVRRLQSRFSKLSDIDFDMNTRTIITDNLELINYATGQLVREFTVVAAEITAVSFHPDNNALLVGKGRQIDQIDLTTTHATQIFADSSGQIKELCYAGNGQRLAGVSSNGKVFIWHADSLEAPSHTLLLKENGLAAVTNEAERKWSLSFNKDAKKLAIGGNGIWNTLLKDTPKKLETPNLLTPNPLPGFNEIIFSPVDDTYLASLEREHADLGDTYHIPGIFGQNNQLIYELEPSFNKQFPEHRRFQHQITSFLFSSDGAHVAALFESEVRRDLEVWNVATGKPSWSHPAVFQDESGRAYPSNAPRLLKFDSKKKQALILLANPSESFLANVSAEGKVSMAKPLPDLHQHLYVFSADFRLLARVKKDSPAELELWDIEKNLLLNTFVALAKENAYFIYTPELQYKTPRDVLPRLSIEYKGSIFGFEQFDLLLNRPDIVLKRLPDADSILAEDYTAFYQHRSKTPDTLSVLKTRAPGFPQIIIRNQKDIPQVSTDDAVTIAFHVEKTGGSLPKQLRVYVNGLLIQTADLLLLSHSPLDSITVALNSGKNYIELEAVNKNGIRSPRKSIEIYREGHNLSRQLYVLTIGVSEYKDSRKNLRFAAKDARDLAKIFKTPGNGYKTIHAKSLLNREAIRANILAAKQLLTASGINDLVIVFIAGHGIRSKNGYYFATYDIDFDNPQEKGLTFDDIRELFTGIPARKKLLFMDTCNAGVNWLQDNIIDDDSTLYELAKNGRHIEPIRQVQRTAVPVLENMFVNLDETLGITTIAASAWNAAAYEGTIGNNGDFSQTLITALTSPVADKNGNGEIEVSELRDYVIENVPRATGYRQTPVVRNENIKNDFAIFPGKKPLKLPVADRHPKKAKRVIPAPKPALSHEQFKKRDQAAASRKMRGISCSGHSKVNQHLFKITDDSLQATARQFDLFFLYRALYCRELNRLFQMPIEKVVAIVKNMSYRIELLNTIPAATARRILFEMDKKSYAEIAGKIDFINQPGPLQFASVEHFRNVYRPYLLNTDERKRMLRDDKELERRIKSMDSAIRAERKDYIRILEYPPAAAAKIISKMAESRRLLRLLPRRQALDVLYYLPDSVYTLVTENWPLAAEYLAQGGDPDHFLYERDQRFRKQFQAQYRPFNNNPVNKHDQEVLPRLIDKELDYLVGFFQFRLEFSGLSLFSPTTRDDTGHLLLTLPREQAGNVLNHINKVSVLKVLNSPYFSKAPRYYALDLLYYTADSTFFELYDEVHVFQSQFIKNGFLGKPKTIMTAEKKRRVAGRRQHQIMRDKLNSIEETSRKERRRGTAKLEKMFYKIETQFPPPDSLWNAAAETMITAYSWIDDDKKLLSLVEKIMRYSPKDHPLYIEGKETLPILKDRLYNPAYKNWKKESEELAAIEKVIYKTKHSMEKKSDYCEKTLERYKKLLALVERKLGREQEIYYQTYFRMIGHLGNCERYDMAIKKCDEIIGSIGPAHYEYENFKTYKAKLIKQKQQR